MNTQELFEQRKEVGYEIERRRGAGGYSVDAPSILDLYVHMHKLISHAMEQDKKIAELTEQLAEKTKKK